MNVTRMQSTVQQESKSNERVSERAGVLRLCVTRPGEPTTQLTLELVTLNVYRSHRDAMTSSAATTRSYSVEKPLTLFRWLECAVICRGLARLTSIRPLKINDF